MFLVGCLSMCVFLHSLLYSNKTQSEKRKDVENRKEIVSM